MRKALIPGSFNPVTLGHFDMARRCASLFEEVHVVVFENTAKQGKGLFSGEECLEMLQIAFKDIPNIHTGATNKLVVDYAREEGIDTLVKGVRNVGDYEYESDLSVINRTLGNIETLFIPARPEYRHISSSVVQELIKYRCDIDSYVPAGVNEYIKAKIQKIR